MITNELVPLVFVYDFLVLASENLYLKLDSNVWNEFDYDNTHGITGTIYTDRTFSSPKNLTGLTLTIRLSKRWHITDRLNKTASIVSGSNGTWEYKPSFGDLPRAGIYLLEVELSNGDNLKKSTRPVEFFIRRSAGA